MGCLPCKFLTPGVPLPVRDAHDNPTLVLDSEGMACEES